ncbi:MAG: hypothetical protein ABI468_06485, partial [Candidatus Nanopelagicales bacterium]
TTRSAHGGPRRTIHAYPTYASGTWDAAIEDLRTRLRRPSAARAVIVLTGARRRWLDLRARRG